jgi:hypothetical protein
VATPNYGYEKRQKELAKKKKKEEKLQEKAARKTTGPADGATESPDDVAPQTDAADPTHPPVP